MSEIEINEDNCVLDSLELTLVDIIFQLISGAKTMKGIKVNFETKATITKIFQKINKLNDLAKQAKDKINHNDYIRHETAPF